MGSIGTNLLICLMFIFNLLFAVSSIVRVPLIEVTSLIKFVFPLQITGLCIMVVGVGIQTAYQHYSNFVGKSLMNPI